MVELGLASVSTHPREYITVIAHLVTSFTCNAAGQYLAGAENIYSHCNLGFKQRPPFCPSHLFLL